MESTTNTETKLNLGAPWNPYEEKELESFITDLSKKLSKHLLNRPTSHNTPVIEFRQPEDIRKLIPMEIGEPTSLKDLRSSLDTIMELSVKTDHPHFFNQLFAQADPVATVGEWVTAVMNASMYTYEVAPVLTCMEKDVLKLMESYLGFLEAGKPSGNGIFCPGGSISNLLALNVARYWKFPEVKEDGMHSVPKMAFFASELAHYSIKKGCQILGIGSKGLFEVKADARGVMIPEELRITIAAAIEQGYVPTCITSTAGTTVFGAYDDITAISEISKEFDMWLHIDGAWGGSVILTTEFSTLMKGTNLADSITWNPHKLMGIPQQCSALILHSKHAGLLKAAHSTAATYLFQADKENGDLDTGDTTIQCGRRNDILKLWMMWKAIGQKGMTERLDHVWGISRYLVTAIKDRSDRFVMVNDPMCTNVCFYYCPPCLKEQGFEITQDYCEWSTEHKEKMGKVCPAIKKMMQERGSMLCTYQTQGEYVNFWRMVLISSCLSSKDMDFVLDEIEECGKMLTL
jgi:sulfinoalanine decarboxylase